MGRDLLTKFNIQMSCQADGIGVHNSEMSLFSLSFYAWNVTDCIIYPGIQGLVNTEG